MEPALLERMELDELLEGAPPATRAPVSHPRLAALVRAGTRHVYVDTADGGALESLAQLAEGHPLAEVDGNTVNQPLMHKVLSRALDVPFVGWARRRNEDGDARGEDLAALLYAGLCVRAGAELVRRSGRPEGWEISLQLPMGVVADGPAALALGERIHRALPQALIKVPFRPQHPQSLLVARALERRGVPVNLTSTFSARQVAVGALLTGAARTNVFMGRLDQGLSAERLGEHVVLEAQRCLLALRAQGRTRSELIVASVRHWRHLADLAGCDAFTAPPEALRAFLEQRSDGPIVSALEPSRDGEARADRLGVADEVRAQVAPELLERLWRVEEELLDFLGRLDADADELGLDAGDELRRRFDAAGFGDLFHDPDPREEEETRASKLPALDSSLARRVPLDTAFTLHADADFVRHQQEMDAEILRATRG